MHYVFEEGGFAFGERLGGFGRHARKGVADGGREFGGGGGGSAGR